MVDSSRPSISSIVMKHESACSISSNMRTMLGCESLHACANSCCRRAVARARSRRSARGAFNATRTLAAVAAARGHVARLIDDSGAAVADDAFENEAVAQDCAGRQVRQASGCGLSEPRHAPAWARRRSQPARYRSSQAQGPWCASLEVRRGFQVRGGVGTRPVDSCWIEECCRHGLRPIPLFLRLRPLRAAPAGRASDTSARCPPRPTENRSPA